MLNLLYILSGHRHTTMLKYTYIEHSKLPCGMNYDAPRALYAGFITRSLAANDETKMAAPGGIAGSENRLISFFLERTKALLAEAEQCIYVFSSPGDIDRIEMLHERLSGARGKCFYFERESFQTHQFGS